jgi:hypothetical protein
LLKDMDVSSAGHRLRIRNAIANLGAQVQSGSADGPLMSGAARRADSAVEPTKSENITALTDWVVRDLKEAKALLEELAL